MNKKHLLILVAMLLITAVLVSCQQDTSSEIEASPTVGVSQTSVAVPTTTQATPVTQSATAVPPPTATPLALATRTTTPEPSFADEGALIELTMTSQVGVLLDEIPPELRDEVAAAILSRPDSYWISQARQQTQLTKIVSTSATSFMTIKASCLCRLKSFGILNSIRQGQLARLSPGMIWS